MPAVSFVKLVKKLLHHLFLLYPIARVREVWFAYNCALCWCPFSNVMGQQTRSLGPMTKAHEGRRSLAYQLRRKSLLQKTGSVKGLRHNRKEEKRRPIQLAHELGPKSRKFQIVIWLNATLMVILTHFLRQHYQSLKSYKGPLIVWFWYLISCLSIYCLLLGLGMRGIFRGLFLPYYWSIVWKIFISSIKPQTDHWP